MDDIRLLNGPLRRWRRWRSSEHVFQRESDGLYVCVITDCAADAWSQAAIAFADYDSKPDWARPFPMMGRVGEYLVVAINYDKRTVTLQDPSGDCVVIECPE